MSLLVYAWLFWDIFCCLPTSFTSSNMLGPFS